MSRNLTNYIRAVPPEEFQLHVPPKPKLVKPPGKPRGKVSGLTAERIAVLEARLAARDVYLRTYSLKALQGLWGVSEHTVESWQRQVRERLLKRPRLAVVTNDAGNARRGSE